jgi:mono/diheme cytochrome c family protein
VADIVSKKCTSCHGTVLNDGAPMALLKRSDFTATSPLDANATIAQRSVTRMQGGSAPMPPAIAPAVTSDEAAAFAHWVNDGTPSGSCSIDPDGGLGFDAGPAPTTCETNVFRPQPTTTMPHGGGDMAPGWACRSCHIGKNFMGQNPNGALGMTRPYDVMGTVYAGLHEKDLCVSSVGDAGYVVEIFDSTGAMVISAPVNPTGNFYAQVALDAGLKVPYKARVVRGTAVREMTAMQTEQDCNTCHTEQGLNEAPGRIQGP